MSKEIKRLESRLTAEQITAAQLLAVNKFLPRPPKDATDEEIAALKADGNVRLQLGEIAQKLGVSERTLYNWRNSNEDFTKYVNLLATNVFMSHLPDIMEKHLDMTLKGQGSMKGIELFYKFGGLLIDKQEVKTEEVGAGESLDDRLARLKARSEAIQTEEQKEDA
jgi:DNA-binding CsgD family transcriptional regulator